MSIQVELTPEEEERLRDRAQRHNKTPEVFVGDIVRALITTPSVQPQNQFQPVVDESGTFHQDRWDRVMESIRKESASAPSLPSEALTREALYSDHD